MENIEFDVFPKISHVQQKTEYGTEQHNFWKLFPVNLPLKDQVPLAMVDSDIKLGSLTSSNIVSSVSEVILKPPGKVPNLRSVLKRMKAEYPEFPAYKTFRLLREKCEKFKRKQEEIPVNKSKKKSDKPKRGRKRKTPALDKSVEIIELETVKVEEHPTWTEKYKAQCADDILGNTHAVGELKNWLKSWVDFSREMSLQSKSRGRDSGSSSEFETTDGDSRDSGSVPNNTVILCGPFGCGKTMTVYALCNELGINVLELNASTKRTGE